jgi:2,4-dienoyl-CoA reductase (NADPH2)
LVFAAPGKEEFSCLIDNLKADMDRLGIKIVYNKEATKENVVSANFEVVIVSSGSTPRKIKLPNNQGSIPVVTAAEILNQKYIAGKNVVVIGGGSVGCEAALYLSEEAALSKEQLMFLTVHNAESPEKIRELLNESNRNVSIIEMQNKIGAGFDPGTGWPVFKQMKRLGIKQYTLANITDITEDSVVFVKDGERMTQKADTIVLAIGSASNNDLYDSLKGEIGELYTIGDAKEIGKVMSAMKQAVDLAVSI